MQLLRLYRMVLYCNNFVVAMHVSNVSCAGKISLFEPELCCAKVGVMLAYCIRLNPSSNHIREAITKDELSNVHRPPSTIDRMNGMYIAIFTPQVITSPAITSHLIRNKKTRCRCKHIWPTHYILLNVHSLLVVHLPNAIHLINN